MKLVLFFKLACGLLLWSLGGRPGAHGHHVVYVYMYTYTPVSEPSQYWGKNSIFYTVLHSLVFVTLPNMWKV